MNQRVSPFQQLGCMQENQFLQWATWATHHLRELLCRREEVDDLGGCCRQGKTGYFVGEDDKDIFSPYATDGCPRVQVVDLTPGGGLAVFSYSAPSGAKRAESHRRSRMIQYILPMGSGDGTAVKFQSPERRGVQRLQTVGQLAVSFHAADNRTYLLDTSSTSAS